MIATFTPSLRLSSPHEAIPLAEPRCTSRATSRSMYSNGNGPILRGSWRGSVAGSPPHEREEMAVIMTVEIPGADATLIDKMRAGVVDALAKAPGFISNRSGAASSGYRVIEVQESREAHRAWYANHIALNLPPGGRSAPTSVARTTCPLSVSYQLSLAPAPPCRNASRNASVADAPHAISRRMPGRRGRDLDDNAGGWRRRPATATTRRSHRR